MIDDSDQKVTISAACMQGYKSALKWWYGKNNKVLEPEINKSLDDFIDGYKKLVQRKKSSGVMEIKEGKSPLSFSGYVAVSKHLASMKPKGVVRKNQTPHVEGIFAWPFFVLSWNLLARSENVGALHVQHMSWSNDCLTVRFARSKGDPTGKTEGDLKHVYANPFNPVCCPILSLAVYTFCHHRGSNDSDNKFFGGTRPETRFLKILETVVVELATTHRDLGAAAKDIGCHSTRKGAISFLCGLCHCITAIMVYLRAGWSVGKVQDRYIFAGMGGDQLVGRAVSGLSVNKKEFAVLPPHFDDDDLAILDDIGWEEILEDYTWYPDCFKRIIPYLLASLLYHEQWLRQTLDPIHPLWRERVFTSRYLLPSTVTASSGFSAAAAAITTSTVVRTRQTLSEYFSTVNSSGRNRILLEFGFCPHTNMTATGIPDHLVIAHQLSCLTDEVKSLKENLRGELETFFSHVDDRLDEMPQKLMTMLMDNFQIDNVAPITSQQVQQMIDRNGEKITLEVRTSCERAMQAVLAQLQTVTPAALEEVSAGSATARASNGPLMDSDISSRFQTFAGNGCLRMVPVGFVFPTYAVKPMWDLWWFGDEASRIQPYRFLHTKFRSNLESKAQRGLVSKAARVVEEIVKRVPPNSDGTPSKAINEMSKAESDAAFKLGFSKLMTTLYGDNQVNRAGDKYYTTVANRIYKVLGNSTSDRDDHSSTEDGNA